MRNTALLCRWFCLLAVFFAGGILLPSCEKDGPKREKIEKKKIVVHGEKMSVHIGTVGVGKFEKQATYVLVDAENTSNSDVSVTLGGILLNKEGQTVDKIIRQSLRIPARGRRTFALVGHSRTPHPEATGATIEVTSVVKIDYKEQITITDFHEYEDGNRVVVKAYVQNTVGRIGKALVFATFYDSQERPIERPSSVFHLERHAKRGVQFVGPPGSVRATMSVGDIVY